MKIHHHPSLRTPALALAAAAALPFTLGSCIADEPLNAECDIEQVSLHFDNPLGVFYHDYDTLRTVPSSVDLIEFVARPHATVGLVPIHFVITPGATLYHISGDSIFQNGSALDFSDNQMHLFQVRSEDGKWDRTYRLRIVHEQPSEGDMAFTFSTYALDASGKYYEWHAGSTNAAAVFTDGIWKNGNPGFKLSKGSALPLEYPSTPVFGGGPDGTDCVKLETMDTGAFGRMVNMRIASGSMFNGTFDVGNALKDALAATIFGSPFGYKPTTLRAQVRYERGELFQDRSGNPVADILDEPDFYVVMYRNEDADGNRVQLDGSNVLSSPYIVGKARLPHNYNADGSDQLSATPIHGLTEEWQTVELQVEYSQELDADILANKGYSLVIGFASSWQGAYFQGAVGSKLFIDNVELYCE